MMADDINESSGLNVVPTSEILAKIEKGKPVEYDHVTIMDDIDVSKLNLRNDGKRFIITIPISIINSIIKGNVNFTKIAFYEGVNFSGTQFNGFADFKGSEFNGVTNFRDSKFNKPTDFRGSEFNEVTDFKKTEFYGDTNFIETVFNEDTDFENSKFNKPTDFRGSKFSRSIAFERSKFQEVYFSGSQFDGNAYFNRSQFEEYTTFWKSRFNANAYFMESKFNGDTNFRETEFNGDTKFTYSKFNKPTDFSSSKFKGKTDFNESQFNGEADFSLAKFSMNANFIGATFIGDALFEGANFEEGLSLVRTKYDRLYIRWISFTKPRYQWKFLKNWRRVNNLAYEETAYLLLVENFRKIGFFEDADECYYTYRKNYRIGDPIRRLFDLAARFLFGYGVKPALPLVWSAIIILLSGIFFKVYLSTSFGEAFFLSTTAFTSGVNPVLNSTLASIPHDGSALWIFTLERLLGPLFFALFLVSIGKTIIR
jgi:hypothetical protein